MLRKSTRIHSARHLSDDYVRDSLSLLLSEGRKDSPTFNPTANTRTAVSTDLSTGLPLLADHPRKQKLTQAEIPERPEKVLPPAPLPPSATATSPPAQTSTPHGVARARNKAVAARIAVGPAQGDL